MSWIRRKLSQVTNNNASTSSSVSPTTPQSPTSIRFEVFKSHWLQVSDIICSEDGVFIKTHSTLLKKPKPVTQDDADAVRNLLEQMIYLLVEEQTAGLQLGPILEYLVTNKLMLKLFQWFERSGELQKQIAMNQIKVYEVLISQAQHSLLHHRQLITPMLKLLSSCSEMNSEEVDSHVVLLLNLLCVWISRDPTLLEVFFGSSDDQGATNFLIFSLLIGFIHREGSIGQQARDALLLCITMSCENERIAEYIVKTDFCPVLATGLSGLYSSLPRQIDVRADEWHFLRKQDWSQVPALVNFMNSFEFCNSVIEVSCGVVSENLLNYIYNGFLVSVFGPALHKPSASEVIVTTAYLNLFLQSVTAPELLQCFLKFLLCHRHDNSLIINTLIQRIGSNSRLAAVSLSLFRTLLDLDCEDLMLHLVFRYLIPCQHILASQHRSICDVDMYSASAHRFINLAPLCFNIQSDKTSLNNELSESPSVINKSVKDVAVADADSKERSNSQVSAGSNNSNHSDQSEMITSPTTMAEFGPDHDSQMLLHTSYMDYLESANSAIASCKEACKNWSEPYDGKNPSTDSVTEVKGLTGSMSAGLLHDKALSLLSINDEENHKTHAESDPFPMQYQKLQGAERSPALHALNATYQALNATAQVLNIKRLSTLPMNGNAEELNHEINSLPEEHKEQITDPDQNNSVDVFKEESDIPEKNGVENGVSVKDDVVLVNGVKNSGNVSEQTNDEKNESAISDEATANSSFDNYDPDNKEKDNKPSNAQTSSVDEFFRRLMDSVPKNARDRIEGKVSSPTEDTGIEFPIEDDSFAERLNSTASNEPDGTHRQASVNSEDSSYEKSLEDHDENWEDDSMSINSSFYEPDLEYTPAEFSVAPLVPRLKMHAMPYTGPFLSTLFGKLDQMPSNSLYENLLLTGIISRLSIYPQPLIRSFLLNTYVVFHPAVRSLYQVLTGVKNRIESYAANVENFDALLCRAEKYLLARGNEAVDTIEQNLVQDTPMPVPRVKTRNTALGEVFLRRKRRKPLTQKGSKLDTLVEKQGRSLQLTQKTGFEGQSMFYAVSNTKFFSALDKQNNDTRTKNVVFACVILHEFLKELAAISQEHAVTCA
uniref:FTS and Hook-interacting protein-like n=1 Tax=Styela clava TaxID=7725 RepID=UPI00193944BC|nr:FTS and Hook-interacting protein-like [Styela clava]